MAIIPLAEIYRREAERLRSMADAFAFYAARDEFLSVAARFDALAALEGQKTDTADRAEPHSLQLPA
jgi:hypothetical protein